MPKPLTITAVCGWTVPPLWFGDLVRQRFPGASVNAVYPQTPHDKSEAESILSRVSSSLIIGYSLGSLWILRYRKFIAPQIRIALLAPILAFPREENLGGKVSRTQLKYLIRMISRNSDDLSFLFDFYRLSGLKPPGSLLEEFTDRKVLIRGLEFLNSAQASAETDQDHISIMGENDTLLDAKLLKNHISGLTVLPRAGHAPEPLLQALFERLK